MASGSCQSCCQALCICWQQAQALSGRPPSLLLLLLLRRLLLEALLQAQARIIPGSA
jgi:hypothetical protein